MKEELNVLTKTYDFCLWLLPQIEKFPRTHKFIIGDRIENGVLDILESLIDATYSHQKFDILKKANIRLEKLRFLIRLAKDMHFRCASTLQMQVRCMKVFSDGEIQYLLKDFSQGLAVQGQKEWAYVESRPIPVSSAKMCGGWPNIKPAQPGRVS